MSHGNACISCAAVHSAVGCSVTLKCITRWRSCARTTNTYRILKLKVGTTKKLTDTNCLEALKTLDGKPIIAADTADNRYFKRLRIVGTDGIVLESLDSGGDYGPVVLAAAGKGKNCLERVWPVAGVLFELPN